jgi:hypothetical protein
MINRCCRRMEISVRAAAGALDAAPASVGVVDAVPASVGVADAVPASVGVADAARVVGEARAGAADAVEHEQDSRNLAELPETPRESPATFGAMPPTRDLRLCPFSPTCTGVAFRE